MADTILDAERAQQAAMRDTRTWVRVPEGWRVLAAHIAPAPRS
jgi:hypothetical protein